MYCPWCRNHHRLYKLASLLRTRIEWSGTLNFSIIAIMRNLHRCHPCCNCFVAKQKTSISRALRAHKMCFIIQASVRPDYDPRGWCQLTLLQLITDFPSADTVMHACHPLSKPFYWTDFVSLLLRIDLHVELGGWVPAWGGTLMLVLVCLVNLQFTSPAPSVDIPWVTGVPSPCNFTPSQVPLLCRNRHERGKAGFTYQLLLGEWPLVPSSGVSLIKQPLSPFPREK